MKIEILGGGCQKCDTLKKLTQEVADELNINYEIEKVTDMVKIMEYQVMMTPALVIDGTVKHSGSVPSKQQLKLILEGSC